MISERRGRRLAERSAFVRRDGTFGFWARRAWERLTASAGREDPVALRLLCELALDAAAPRQRDAQSCVAELWAHSRDRDLREVVVRAGAIARGPGRLVTAALHKRLSDYWFVGDVGEATALLMDPDPDVRAGTVAAVQVAEPRMHTALWNVVNMQVAQYTAGGGGTWWRAPLPAVLLESASPAPAPTLDVMWRTWLSTPDESLWQPLHRWQIVASLTDVRALSLVAIEPDPRRLAAADLRPALLDAAGRDHPIATIARRKIVAADDQDLVDSVCEAAMTQPTLVSFCRANRYAPADPVRRAMFFVLTGQSDQLEALDPDGSLLALAYAGADQSSRARIQKAMLSSGSLDLVRVLVGEDRRGRIETMTEAEIQYLAQQLAARGAWNELWHIVLDLPLVRAVRLAASFNGGWRPADEDSSELFARLCSLDANTVERGITNMRGIWPPAVRQARIMFRGRVNDVSFAPDAPHLAVAGSSRVAGIVDLTQGRLVERYEAFDASVGRILHVGHGTFLAGERTNTATNPCRVLRCAGRRVATVAQVRGSITSLAQVGSSRYVAGTRAGSLLMGSIGDESATRVSVSRLGLDREQDWPRTIAVDPAGERLAILGRNLTLTDVGATRVIASGYQQTVVARAALLSLDSLATSDQSGNVTLLRRTRDTLRPTAHTTVSGLGGLAPIGTRQQVVVASRSGDLFFHDQTSLARTGEVAGQTDGQATSLHVAPRGDFLAVGFDAGFTDLYDLRVGDVPALASRPLATMVPAHLGVLASARQARVVTGAPAQVLDLLQACLEHRFRFDIEISDMVTLATGEYDIALA